MPSPPPPPEVVRDAPGREHDNQTLRDERFRLLVQGVTDYAIFMLDPGGRVVCWNTGAEKVFGYPDGDAVGHPYAMFFTPEDVAAGEPDRELRAATLDGRFETECQQVRKDGTRFVANVVIAAVREDGTRKLIGYSQITRDISERRRLEEQVRQSQKMEAVAGLAAGVAHDFNNLLTVINGYGELLLGHPRLPAEVREPVRLIAHAGGRAAILTRKLLALGRKQMLAPKVLDLNALLAEFDPLLRRLVGAGVGVVVAPADGLRPVEADPVQVEQILINLAVNARDAMPRGGRFTVRTANVELGGPGTAGHPNVRPGEYVLLSAADTGVGMAEATRARVFEPFFTTKPFGLGTGLGLSIVYGVVQQSGGHVEVASRPGAGATFSVYLPAADAPRPKGRPAPAPVEPAGGGETILLVEDEPAIRELGRMVFERAGYAVLTAADGRAALALAAAHPGPIHLLVTDVVMPNMGGLELAAELRLERGDLKVLYVSGFSEAAVAHQGAFAGPVPFLQKPFSPRALAQKARQTLDG